MTPGPVSSDDLFSPVHIAHAVLDNRIAVAPMTRISATEDGVPTEQMARYYRRFAEGGFALIITEGVYMDRTHSQGYFNQPGLTNDEQEQAWARVVADVHAAGGKIFAQLMHAGAQSQGNRFVATSIGPSAVRPKDPQLAMYRGDGPYAMPRAIERHEMTDVRRSFAAAARRAVGAGFDGVELHGANGYLLDQFLTDYLNERDDEFGGSPENRVRFAAEVCEDVLAEVGSELAVGIRVSQGKASDLNHRWAGGTAEARAIFGRLGRTGIHFLHTTEHQAMAPAFATGPETLAELAKQHGRVPVIVNGQLDEPRAARAIVESGTADVVALGKAALANSDWPRRVRQGDEINPEIRTGTLSPLANIKEWELGVS